MSEEVKEDTVEQEAQELMEVDEVETSAKTVHLLFGAFRQLGYRLAERKKKAPIRVLEAFLFEGLEDIQLNGKEEQNLLDICKQLVYHKNILINYALENREQKKQESTNE